MSEWQLLRRGSSHLLKRASPRSERSLRHPALHPVRGGGDDVLDLRPASFFGGAFSRLHLI